ncbi:MAG: hypothetical protein CSA38_00405 [Flavobacteriales bacterium]|nr:MAG: hypothetical protein CSA38_00405 [Flavobacteriales bacterium]
MINIKNNILWLGLAMLIVITNGLVGHFYPPNGIFFTPVVLISTTFFVCFGTKKIRFIYLSFLTYFFVAFNDILVKLYTGGTHDIEGQHWIHLLLIIGLIPVLLIFFASLLKKSQDTLLHKIFSFILLILLIVLHLKLFKNLGV